MNKLKRDRFIRIAEARTNKAIDMLRLLGNCADKNNYEYSDDDARQIFQALQKELNNTKNKFSGIDSNNEVFKLQYKEGGVPDGSIYEVKLKIDADDDRVYLYFRVIQDDGGGELLSVTKCTLNKKDCPVADGIIGDLV